MVSRLQRFLIGKPMKSTHPRRREAPKLKALAVLSSDALSSVA
ncbi:hypothetical protein [Cohnella faecalis]|nr:hypothetical protein [Cohnella faecalis]